MHWFATVVGVGIFAGMLRFFHRRMVDGTGDPLSVITDPMARSMATFFVGVAIAAGALGYHGILLLIGWIS